MNNKVIARIFGGIGNQLFCYAAARRLALVNNSELVIDHESGFVRDYKYKRNYQLHNFNIPCRLATNKELLKPFSLVRRYLLRHYNRKRIFYNRKYICQDGFNYEPRLLLLKVNGTVYLEGYWQSENYFLDIEDVIRRDLQIKYPSDPQNTKLVTQISKCTSVAVHVRFFDAPNSKSNNNVPMLYYKNAINKLQSLVPDAHFFIFSDNIDAAKKLIYLPDCLQTYVFNNNSDDIAIADLWLMSQCQNFIIANSSFSWWGAWLSKNKQKIVITPEFKASGVTTIWNIENLIPKKWIKIKL